MASHESKSAEGSHSQEKESAFRKFEIILDSMDELDILINGMNRKVEDLRARGTEADKAEADRLTQRVEELVQEKRTLQGQVESLCAVYPDFNDALEERASIIKVREMLKEKVSVVAEMTEIMHEIKTETEKLLAIQEQVAELANLSFGLSDQHGRLEKEFLGADSEEQIQINAKLKEVEFQRSRINQEMAQVRDDLALVHSNISVLKQQLAEVSDELEQKTENK